MAIELIQIKDGNFPKTDTINGTGLEYIVVSKADGVTYGMLTSDFKDFLGTVQVQVPKALSPSDPAPTLAGIYIPTESGTYPDGIVVDLSEGYNQLIFDGADWVKVVTPIDLSSYATKIDLDSKTDNSDFLPVKNKADRAFDLDNDIVIDKVITTQELGVSAYGVGVGIYKWGFPVGRINKANTLGIRFNHSNPSAVTLIDVEVRDTDRNGTLLQKKRFTVNFPAGQRYYDAVLDGYIEDVDKAYVIIRADQPIGIYGTGATAQIFTAANGYSAAAYSTTSDIDSESWTNPGFYWDVYLEINEEINDIVATPRLEEIITEVIGNTPVVLPAPATDSIEVTESLFNKGSVERIDDALQFDDGVGPQGNNYYGFGCPVGILRNFRHITVKVYHTSAMDPQPTKMKAVLKAVNSSGDEIKRAELLSLPVFGTSTDIEFDFGEVIDNIDGVQLWLEVYADGKFGVYKRFPNPTSIFTSENGYPQSLINVGTNAYDTESISANGGYNDYWLKYSQYEVEITLTEQGKRLFGSEADEIEERLPANNKRYSFVGSSVTWGDGYLQSGYVANVINRMQSGFAKSIMPSDLDVLSGTLTPLPSSNNRKLFQGTASKITGTGSEVSFVVTGDEVTICQLIERSNTSASVIEVFADDVKIGEFNNFNTSEIGTDTKTFTGDGDELQFDLGRAFTYGHTVKVNGSTKVVSHNTAQGTGFSIPSGADCAIIRKYGTGVDGSIEVHHYVWFKVTPASGDTIEVSFNYGEEICYEKTTVGKTDSGVLECPYGDGDISFDTTNPTGISSGLDFRQTDERSIAQFRFSDKKERTIRLRIKGNYGSASGTPYFVFNFATNRFFHFQNAGIGGWQLFGLTNSFFNNRNWRGVVGFEPDSILLECTPNEDWQVKGHKLYTKYDGLTLGELRSLDTLPLREIAYQTGSDTYNMSKWVGKVSAITSRTVAFVSDSDHITDADPAPGDLVRIGTFFGDNREYVERFVQSYNSATNTITFDRPIQNSEYVMADISDFVGRDIVVRDYATMTDVVTDFISKVRDSMPDSDIAIIGNPLPNLLARELWGYNLLFKKIANDLGIQAIDIKQFYTYQKSQYRNIEVTVAASELADDPIRGYKWAELSGTPAGTNSLFPQIIVNGVDVFGKDAYLRSGWGYGVSRTNTGSALNKSVGSATNNGQDFQANKPYLVFTQNAPVSGNVTIKYTSVLWSGDSCHINAISAVLYGDMIVNEFLLK